MMDDNLIICIIYHCLSYSLECGSCSLLGNEPSYGSTNSRRNPTTHLFLPNGAPPC